jgi:hypothetical protein
VVYLFLAGIPYQNFRFGLTLYLPLTLLAGYGTVDLWHWAAQRGHKHRRGVEAAVLLSGVGMLLWAYPMLNQFLGAQNQTKAIVQALESRVTSQSVVLSFGLTLTLQHYGTFHTLELIYCEPDDLAQVIALPQPVYFIADVNNLSEQWSGYKPDVNYSWLQTHTQLTPLIDWPPYTLFQVQQTESSRPTVPQPTIDDLCAPGVTTQP